MRRRLSLPLAFGLALATLPAHSQTTQDDALNRLLHHDLYLRGGWSSPDLLFNADGAPAAGLEAGSFTTAGVDVTRVQIRGDHMRIEGHRMGLEFDHTGTPHRVELRKGLPPGKPIDVRIEINGHGNRDFTHALDAIFADGLAQVVPTLPEEWQHYGRAHFLPASDPAHTAAPDQRPFGPPCSADDAAPSPCGAHARRNQADATDSTSAAPRPRVTRPRLLRNQDAEFSEAARAMKYSANVQVGLTVEEDGSVRNVEIARPAGLGLDEQAVAAVSRYQFDPATRNGEPVATKLFVEVNFQVF